MVQNPKGGGLSSSFGGGGAQSMGGVQKMKDEFGNWIQQTERDNVASALSPLAGNITHALGLALASKIYRQNPEIPLGDHFSVQGNE